MLVVTIHDVAPPHLAAVSELRSRIASWGVRSATLLAVPNYHDCGTLADCAEIASWLKSRVHAGDEVALHGITHRAKTASNTVRDRLRARAWTAGEGEMLAATAPASTQLAAARDDLAELVGARVTGFVAPAWLEPAHLASRLAAIGFGWHETSTMVERLHDRARTIAPVIGFATRSYWRMRAAVTWSRTLTPVLARFASASCPARVALHPGDLASAPVMAEAERVIRALAARFPSVTTSTALGIA